MASDSECTLREVRRTVAPRVGYYLASTATSGGASSLIDAKHPVKSSLYQDDLFPGKWILRPDAADADKVRIVADNGYTPSTGTLVPDTDWSSSPSAAEVYEIHGACDPWNDYLDIINTALRRCYVNAEVIIVPTPGSKWHGFNTAAPWLQAAHHVRQIGFLRNGELRADTDPYRRLFRGDVYEDQGAVVVTHPHYAFQDGDLLFAKCLKSAYHSCKPSGGSFGDQAGFALDTDVAPVALEWLRAAALVEYWERYAGAIPEGDPGGKASESRLLRVAADFDTMSAKYLRVPPRMIYPNVVGTGLAGRH
jgi:hypothetical protein